MIRKRVRETVRKTDEQGVKGQSSADMGKHWVKQRALRVSPSGFVRKESGWMVPFLKTTPSQVRVLSRREKRILRRQYLSANIAYLDGLKRNKQGSLRFPDECIIARLEVGA